jgi:hypothetical protein
MNKRFYGAHPLRLTIKALGWIIALLWIITLILPISVVFSLMKLAEGKNMGIQEPIFSLSNGNLSLTIPLYINNTGFYDISEVSVKIKISRANDAIVTLLENLPDIPARRMVNASCNFSASLNEIFQRHSTLLTEDADLDVDAALHFRVARAIAFNITQNFPTRWGAPFQNLTVYDVAYNTTTHVFSFSISFNNHAFFFINEPLTIELYNSGSEKVGSAFWSLNVPSGESFQEKIEVNVDPSKMTRSGFIRLFFADLKIFEEEWTLP